MAVKIKLKRLGKIRAPYYRIVVADARTKRDGRAIEEIGKYHPKAEPSLIEVDSERAQHWLSVGAQPTDPVRKLLEVTGDWQKFKGLAGAEGTLRTAEPRADKKVAFAAAVAESLQDSGTKTKGRGRAADAKAGDGRAADAKAGDGKAADAKAGDGKAADAKAGDGKAADAKAAKSERPTRSRKSDAASKDSGAATESTATEDSGAQASEAGATEAPAAEPPAAEPPPAEAPAPDAPAADANEATASADAAANAEPAAEGGTESAGDGA